MPHAGRHIYYGEGSEEPVVARTSTSKRCTCFYECFSLIPSVFGACNTKRQGKGKTHTESQLNAHVYVQRIISRTIYLKEGTNYLREGK